MDDWKIGDNDSYINMMKEQEEIVKERLELLEIKLDWETEGQRRFPNLMREVQGNITTWYYNNGTINGLRIVAFETNINFSLE